MPKNFKLLEEKMSPAARARSLSAAQKMIREMPLDDLREARQLTQEQLAESMHIGQAAVSRLEKRTNMYVGTLRRIIHAMGGELEIRAVFPDGAITINHFGEK